MTTCNCMGPQNGEPLCPCQMRAVRSYQGERHYPQWDTPSWNDVVMRIQRLETIVAKHGLEP